MPTGSCEEIVIPGTQPIAGALPTCYGFKTQALCPATCRWNVFPPNAGDSGYGDSGYGDSGYNIPAMCTKKSTTIDLA